MLVTLLAPKKLLFGVKIPAGIRQLQREEAS